jgi:uncharacterized membrane protein
MASNNDKTIGWIVIGILGLIAVSFIIQKIQEFFTNNPWAGWLIYSIIVIIGILFIIFLILKLLGK